MYGVLNNQGKARSLKVFADWTERIAKGEVPPAPPRPKGIERNIVADAVGRGRRSLVHARRDLDRQESSDGERRRTDLRGVGRPRPARRARSEREHAPYAIEIPTREPREKVPSRFPAPNRPSLWWGNEHLWANPPYNPADPHNPMLDSKGRVWMTSKIRRNQDPAWCSDAIEQVRRLVPAAAAAAARRRSTIRRRKKFTLIDTCYSTHHLQFDNDAERDGVLQRAERSDLRLDRHEGLRRRRRTSRRPSAGAARCSTPTATARSRGRGTGSPARGDSVALSAATPAAAAAAAGAARRGARRRFDPKLDTMVSYSLYSVIPSPVDDSVWGVSEQLSPAIWCALQRGNNPPETCKTADLQGARAGLRSARRRHRQPTASSGRRSRPAAISPASIVRKCKDLNGPAKIDGSQCREGWTLYQTTGPKLKGTDIPADFHYYNWVDQHNMLGLRREHAVRDRIELGFAARARIRRRGSGSRCACRIRSASTRAAWTAASTIRTAAGRAAALYANYGTHFVWHIEGGKGHQGEDREVPGPAGSARAIEIETSRSAGLQACRVGQT